MANEELQALLAEWQKTLRLQDWDISVAIKRSFEMGADRGGEIVYNQAKKSARISILNPSDYAPHFIVPQDMERTLVHEMLHCSTGLMMAVEPSPSEKLFEEHFIHALSGSLIGLKRGQ